MCHVSLPLVFLFIFDCVISWSVAFGIRACPDSIDRELPIDPKGEFFHYHFPKLYTLYVQFTKDET